MTAKSWDTMEGAALELELERPRPCEHIEALICGNRMRTGGAVEWCPVCGSLREQRLTRKGREWLDRQLSARLRGEPVEQNTPKFEYEWSEWRAPEWGVR